MAEKFDLDAFNDRVINNGGDALIDFYADWCGPCKMMAPVIEQIAAEYEGKLTVGKVNIDEVQSLAVKYNIMSIPTVMVFKDGKPVDMAVGYQSPAELKELIDKNI